MFKKLFGRKDDSTGAVDPQIVAMEQLEMSVASWRLMYFQAVDALSDIVDMETPNAAHAAKRMAKRAREALK